MVTVIGIDCATKADKVGLARGGFLNGKCTIEEVWPQGSDKPKAKAPAWRRDGGVLATLQRWIELSTPTLLAIDAPLGWPKPLAEGLSSHRAGGLLSSKVDDSGDEFFRRRTDLLVESTFKKRPLEVGANLIARTAYAALRILHALDSPQLAWIPGFDTFSGTQAIEVYPEATLLARFEKTKTRDYKKRLEVLGDEQVSQCLEIPDQRMGEIATLSEHVLDAVLCVLAGADFLRGDVVRPDGITEEIYRKEGFIWFKPKRTDRGAT